MESLTSHQQVAVAMITLIVGSIWAVIKFMRPFLDSVSKPSAGGTTDAVVLSATFADRQVMKEFTESVDRLTTSIDELVLCQRSGNLEVKMLTEELVRNRHLR